MTPVLNAPKHLRILTIDGAGLQAVSILLILDKILSAITETNGLKRKPRPCDVFDVIAGIGSGGWLALLLGRFHMDITACLDEWYGITQRVTVKSKGKGMSMRKLKNRYFDHLTECVDNLTQIYGTGDCLFDDDTSRVRTRHVFVGALRSDSAGYHLFRTYAIPKSVNLLKGPESPSKFKISHAFAVTGAAQHCSPSWTEEISGIGSVKFCDTKSPNPQNITHLALNEIWGLYGNNVSISVIVNVGPGLPSNFNIQTCEQEPSWSKNLALKVFQHQKKRHLFQRGNGNALSRTTLSVPIQQNSNLESIKEKKFQKDLKICDSVTEYDIRRILDQARSGNSGIYYRLALDQVPEGSVENDSFAVGAVLQATQNYLQLPQVKSTIEQIIQKITGVFSQAQSGQGFHGTPLNLISIPAAIPDIDHWRKQHNPSVSDTYSESLDNSQPSPQTGSPTSIVSTVDSQPPSPRDIGSDAESFLKHSPAYTTNSERNKTAWLIPLQSAASKVPRCRSEISVSGIGGGGLRRTNTVF